MLDAKHPVVRLPVYFVSLQGPRTHCPYSAQSKKHDATSHHTADAEIVALDMVVRKDAMPLLQLFETILPQGIIIEVEEDNDPAIVIIDKAKMNTIRHMNRTHRVDVMALHDVFKNEKNMHLRKICHQ